MGVGLILGGGLSNLLERLRQGKVYDYVQFPKAPGRIKQYIFNLADFAIRLGGLCLSLRKKTRYCTTSRAVKNTVRLVRV